MEHKLKPCPFCGGKASVFEYIPDKAVAIRCDRCGATVYSSAASDSEEMLIAKWNHRQAIRDILNVCDEFNKSDARFCGGEDVFDAVVEAKVKLLFDLIVKNNAFRKLAGDYHHE